MADVVLQKGQVEVVLIERPAGEVSLDVQPLAPVVEVVIQRTGIPGERGKQGEVLYVDGEGGEAFASTFTWQPPSPQTTWVVPHNLDRYPSVTCTDSAGEVMYPNIRYLSRNQVELSFAVPAAGFAHLN